MAAMLVIKFLMHSYEGWGRQSVKSWLMFQQFMVELQILQLSINNGVLITQLYFRLNCCADKTRIISNSKSAMTIFIQVSWELTSSAACRSSSSDTSIIPGGKAWEPRTNKAFCSFAWKIEGSLTSCLPVQSCYLVFFREYSTDWSLGYKFTPKTINYKTNHSFIH